MFRIYGKLVKKGRTLWDHTVEIDDLSLTRTKKVFLALDEICHEANLAAPVWLDSNKQDFIRRARTRFSQDNFVEEIDFDYLDFQVIEEEFY